MSNYDSRVRQGFLRCLLLLGPSGGEGQKGLRNLDQGAGCLSPYCIGCGPCPCGDVARRERLYFCSCDRSVLRADVSQER
jgi:hypothetical protein